tara:strand:+ start:256 stop:423 length:168 start_codon:yes stop_codon:yes gene_type:complete
MSDDIDPRIEVFWIQESRTGRTDPLINFDLPVDHITAHIEKGGRILGHNMDGEEE